MFLENYLTEHSPVYHDSFSKESVMKFRTENSPSTMNYDSQNVLIPGLPDEIAVSCLARISFKDFSKSNQASKSWLEILSNPDILRSHGRCMQKLFIASSCINQEKLKLQTFDEDQCKTFINVHVFDCSSNSWFMVVPLHIDFPTSLHCNNSSYTFQYSCYPHSDHGILLTGSWISTNLLPTSNSDLCKDGSLSWIYDFFSSRWTKWKPLHVGTSRLKVENYLATIAGMAASRKLESRNLYTGTQFIIDEHCDGRIMEHFSAAARQEYELNMRHSQPFHMAEADYESDEEEILVGAITTGRQYLVFRNQKRPRADSGRVTILDSNAGYVGGIEGVVAPPQRHNLRFVTSLQGEVYGLLSSSGTKCWGAVSVCKLNAESKTWEVVSEVPQFSHPDPNKVSLIENCFMVLHDERIYLLTEGALAQRVGFCSSIREDCRSFFQLDLETLKWKLLSVPISDKALTYTVVTV